MTLTEITDRIKTKVTKDTGLNAKIKLALDDNEFIHVDATQIPHVVTNSDTDADCTVKVTKQNLSKMLAGELNAYTAFMMGKVKVEGNMALAMNLNKII